ncbi:MAG: hypothetical protein NZ704_04260 [Geminicoccaceae bacterium]|nr:hypothetical protein [Geminicoccaceae bacterium]
MATVAAPREERQILPAPVRGRAGIAVRGGVREDPAGIFDRVEEEAHGAMQALALDLEVPEIVALACREFGDHRERGDRLALIPQGARPARRLQGQAAVGAHLGERPAEGGDSEREGVFVPGERSPGHDRARREIGVVVARARLFRPLTLQPLAGTARQTREPRLDARARPGVDFRGVAHERPAHDRGQQETVDRVVPGGIGRRRSEQGVRARPSVEELDERRPGGRVCAPEAGGGGAHDEPGHGIEPRVGSVAVARAQRARNRPVAAAQILGGAEAFRTRRDDRFSSRGRIDEHDPRSPDEPARGERIGGARGFALATGAEQRNGQQRRRSRIRAPGQTPREG